MRREATSDSVNLFGCSKLIGVSGFIPRLEELIPGCEVLNKSFLERVPKDGTGAAADLRSAGFQK